MGSAVITEGFISSKESEYIGFVEHLSTTAQFPDDKWICDKRRRAPAEPNYTVTLCFSSVPVQYRNMVKFFAVISFIRGKSIATVKRYIIDLVRFYDFWMPVGKAAGIHCCNEFTAAGFYQHLENRGLSEATCCGTRSSVSTFFKTMNGWKGMTLKNPFSISPYSRQMRFDDKYIPEDVALQLDAVFKLEEIPPYLRCIYWLLRLIPSRIGEIVGMRIDCLKRWGENYVLFIPTWKQNGGWKEPILRSIHLTDIGIAGYLISLIKKQQDIARQLQDIMPDCKKGALFTYRQQCMYKRLTQYSTNQFFVASIQPVRSRLQNICVKYNITDSDGKIYRVTTHQFRHNGITDRLAAGFTAEQIAEMTGHHGGAMIYNAYTHLNLLPETIIQKQEFVLKETDSRENRYVLFGGRILNMEEQLEKRLLKNIRAHQVRGGICSDITGCKSDMWNCLECGFFVPDADQTDYYKEQAVLWREKSIRFSDFPIIKANSEKNAGLFESILEKLLKDCGL